MSTDGTESDPEVLFFEVRSGYVNPGETDKLRGAGQSGFGWSAKANESNTTNAYYLQFNNGATDVWPSNNYYRYLGLPMRCL